ncbi:MAG: diacylglycerol kinase family lipid kinase, partial [Actinobacteria bacterium]|nr:diacylglycerol kinase family lipid kinase [Actinomycetota bacterium]
MRGLLLVNPRATTTSPRVTDVLVHALSDQLDLDVTFTTHKGHGIALGQRARQEGLDIVVTLGGDGLIHEVVNGILSDGVAPGLPRLATVPGGSGNVFARALGLPADPVEATGQLLDAIRAGRTRRIGLGRAGERWFIVNAGVGLDAEVIEAMERQRTAGHTATPVRYLGTVLRQLFWGTDRRHPRLTVEKAGSEPIQEVFQVIVQNTSPWTYFGTWPIEPCPNASFDTGLDLFVLRSLGTPNTLRAASRMILHAKGGST